MRTPLTKVEEAMRHALGLAEVAATNGDVPIGAAVYLGNQQISADYNQREHRGDPTAHAEILALQGAAEALDRGWRLSDTTLVVTLEPCPMCAGAALAARVGTIVYGATDPKAGACGSLYNLCADPRLNHEIEVAHGVLADECGAMLSRFFAARRA